jgi:hypothetical protein
MWNLKLLKDFKIKNRQLMTRVKLSGAQFYENGVLIEVNIIIFMISLTTVKCKLMINWKYLTL